MTATGLISFGGGYNDLGLGRFVHLQQVGPDIVNKIPLIAAFLKQRMNGTRSVNELDDRVVITWDTSEPTSGQQDVTFARTPHNYQAVLYKRRPRRSVLPGDDRARCGRRRLHRAGRRRAGDDVHRPVKREGDGCRAGP